MKAQVFKNLKKPGKADKQMNKLVLSGKRPCNGYRDECTPARN